MSNLKEIISKYDIETLSVEKLISKDDIPLYENKVGVKFGPKLQEYLLEYGYIAYKYMMLNGINNIQKTESDMIKSTKSVRKISDKLDNLIEIEDQGDFDLYLVDSNDNMYRYVPEANIFENLNKDLFQYIKERLEIVDYYSNMNN